MGCYLRGDVILAPVAFEERGGAKTRPAIVISAAENGDVQICPVSSRPPTDAPCIPISLNDFSEGGLDLFEESYILTARIRTIRSGEVVGKRGRLTQECVALIIAQTPNQKTKNTDSKKRSR
ncbi:MAG: type II toxin-antitoxin system PemK/MazF family toxin [Methanoregula sp.]|nr:type II toxin-antitoxin system PemK/MazF family toxin [Methanoregula sp.]